MTTRSSTDLFAPGHAAQPFEPGVFDDALDAYPPYHRYEGPVSPEAMAIAQQKAAQLGLIPPAPATQRSARKVSASGSRRVPASYPPPRSAPSNGVAARSPATRSAARETSGSIRARSATTGRFVKKSTALRHPDTTDPEKIKPQDRATTDRKRGK